MSGKKQKDPLLYPSDVSDFLSKIEEVDISEKLRNPNKKLKSLRLIIGGKEYWKAIHSTNGEIWTTNTNDPKIINTITGRPRGSLQWLDGDVGRNKGGRPRGSSNKTTAKDACSNLNAWPQEFMAAVMRGDVDLLKKYGIRNPKEVTIGHKIKCAETLLKKLEGDAKSNQLDANGNILLDSKDVEQENGKTLQVYLTAPSYEVKQFEETGADKYMEEFNQEYNKPYDLGD